MTTSALALIAAPPDSLRYSLQALLARLPHIDSVQSAEDTRSMLAALAATHPVLVVVDVNLPGGDAGSVLTQIKTIAPRARTVVLVDDIDQQRALQTTSADLVLLKGYPAADLFNNVEQLLAQGDPGAAQ